MTVDQKVVYLVDMLERLLDMKKGLMMEPKWVYPLATYLAAMKEYSREIL